ncbi:type II secretion system protein M [Thalassomonas haliotis]|uniref:Type II secretion system protein M n=1 Tax=Thalassomonas haliotis TaxID=485448 RepID=A0ABY7VDJ9_9GAMM|nr:type II secretion system protein M [Thalassomonas haliotis]WDE11623.1 type II secretion system protein M [Thalassomonas haliotis]
MKAKWQQLNAREQKSVIALSAVVLVFILYSLVWQPLNENLAKTQSKLKRQQDLLTWVSDNTSRYQQASKNKQSSRGGSLSSIVNRTAKRNGIGITRMQPQGNDIQIWIDEVSFSQLLQWLEQLANNEGLNVKSIDLNNAKQSGVVGVRRLQLGRG